MNQENLSLPSKRLSFRRTVRTFLFLHHRRNVTDRHPLSFTHPPPATALTALERFQFMTRRAVNAPSSADSLCNPEYSIAY